MVVFRDNGSMYDPEEHKTIKKLLRLFGENECLRLGFLVKNDNQTLGLTIVGTGFLLDIEAQEVSTLHEAYAAGFEHGCSQAKDGF